jgi:cytochrome oxidase Cu insertion factor (SCO1/SenC/PrrC family)
MIILLSIFLAVAALFVYAIGHDTGENTKHARKENRKPCETETQPSKVSRSVSLSSR